MKPLARQDLHHILNRTLELWELVRGKRIFLTGATGFFGKWLLESLDYCNLALDLDLSATVLCRDPQAFKNRMPHLASVCSIHFLEGDVRRFSFPPGSFDYVIHAAASTNDSGDPLDLLSTIVDGTRHTLQFATACKATRFLFVSSGAVYGPQPESISHIPEEYLGGPAWLLRNAAYAEGKRVAEQICALYAHTCNTRISIARCFAFVGPHLPLDQHFAIGNFIGDALVGRDLHIRGDGTAVRSYLYTADLTIWLWTLLLGRPEGLPNPAVLNVGSGAPIDIRSLAYLVRDIINPALKVHVAMEPVPGAPRLQYVPDVCRAAECLGLRPTIPLDEAIRRTAEWYMD